MIYKTLSVPAERGVIAKERMTGAYRLSAYYLAKSASELPLHVIGPIPFYTFGFWMAGLGGVSEFFSTLAILLLTIVTAQVKMPSSQAKGTKSTSLQAKGTKSTSFHETKRT